MAQPLLGWSRRPSRVMLGHYDPSHNAIILSSLLDRPGVPRLCVEYILFHEMLHLRFPVEHRGWRDAACTPASLRMRKNNSHLLKRGQAGSEDRLQLRRVKAKLGGAELDLAGRREHLHLIAQGGERRH